ALTRHIELSPNALHLSRHFCFQRVERNAEGNSFWHCLFFHKCFEELCKSSLAGIEDWQPTCNLLLFILPKFQAIPRFSNNGPGSLNPSIFPERFFQLIE